MRRFAGRVALLLLIGTGCARTINLTDADGPRFQGRFAPAPVEAPAKAIRVVTFNVKLGRAIDQATAVLQGPELADADIVALQEMDDVGVERIARNLGLDYVYFPAVIHPIDRRFFGPAVLSRWPIDSAWKLLLPHEGSVRGQRRTATVALVDVRGTKVRVYAVHLEPQSRLSADEFLDQVEALVDDAAMAEGPVVIAGDFNGHDIGRYLRAKGYEWPTERVGRTSYLFSIDHIFARGLTPADAKPAGVVREVLGASDHRPVWARFSLP